MPEKKPSRGYLAAVLGCYCPRCREGKLFTHRLTIRLKKFMVMNERCPVCGQRTEIETGFYYGTGYVSYGLTVAMSIATFVAWWVLIGMSVDDNRFFWWVGFNAILLIILQPWLMRVCRSIWISWFVKYDPDWKENKFQTIQQASTQQIE